jgi:two-component system cell cycle response regulator DivK
MAAKRILYVEDDQYNFVLVERTLSVLEEVEVVHAKTAAEGLKMAHDNPPDLVLMDLHLPGMDGLEMTRTLKADEQLAAVPVVALTANVMKGERERALQAGCDDFIAKPFNLRSFRELVARHLKLET